MRCYARFGKRSLDLTLALGALLFLGLPLLLLACWIRLVDGAPVLFSQPRVGRNKTLFRIHKLRTMHAKACSDMPVTVAGDLRVTRTGQWLRRFKLDELPQLLNILKGEMSFVGPRPDVPGYLDTLQGPAAALLRLRPGITGPASLAFRNEEQLLATASDPKAFNDCVIFPEKVRLNLEYLEGLCFRKDLLYLYRTLLVLVRSGKTGRRAHRFPALAAYRHRLHRAATAAGTLFASQS